MKKKRQHYDEDESEDFYSPTSWDRGFNESDEDYEDRMGDQEDLTDYYND
jgi:hypothetical protein